MTHVETSLNFHFRNPTTNGNLEAELLFYLPEGNKILLSFLIRTKGVLFVDSQLMFMVR